MNTLYMWFGNSIGIVLSISLWEDWESCKDCKTLSWLWPNISFCLHISSISFLGTSYWGHCISEPKWCMGGTDYVFTLQPLIYCCLDFCCGLFYIKFWSFHGNILISSRSGSRYLVDHRMCRGGGSNSA